MYRTHIQCADVTRAASLKPAPLSTRNLPGGFGASTEQTDSLETVCAGKGAMRGHPVGAIPGRGWQEWAGACLKSCLTLFAACMFFLLPHSLYANTNTGQEIGETYYDSGQFRGVGMVDSATLAPTGDRLYTLKDSVLRQYNLSPLRRISAIKVAFDSRQIAATPYKTFITNDEKRIVIYSKTQLRLLDVVSGKIIKAVPFQSELGVLNDDELFTLGNDNKATVWNVHDLTKKEEYVAWGPTQWSLDDYNVTITNSTLVKAGEHIVLYRPAYSSGNGKTFVFDGTSYRQIWNVGHNDDTPSAISYDLNTLYVPWGRFWQMARAIDLDIKKSQEARYGVILKVDIPTVQVDYVFKENFKLAQYIQLARGAAEQKISPTQKYHLTRHSTYNVYAFFYRAGEKARQTKAFLQFEDGEAAFISKAGFFQATENAGKHLKMKDSKGEIVPINDVTFEKFNKTNINHKDW